MSRLAKKPVKITPGVTITNDGNFLVFKGPKGEKRLNINPGITVKIEAENIWIEPSDNSDANAKAHTGTMWSLARNCIEGVSAGFSKILNIEGVGYKAMLEGKELVLSLGYANPVRFKIADGVTAEVEKNTTIKLSGNDKDLVGLMAANIRALKKPEPYKGKGIRYRGEVVRRKVGKKAGATAGATA